MRLPERPRTLSARLTVVYTSLLAASLLAFALVVFLVFDAGIHAQLDARLEHEAAEFAASIIIRPDGTMDFSSPLVEEHEQIISGVSAHSLQVIARNGRLLWSSPPDSSRTLPPPPLRVPETRSRITSEEDRLPDGRERRLLYHPVFHGERLLGWVQVGAMEDVIQDALAVLRLTLCVVAVLLLAAAGFGGHALARRALRPLTDIAAAAETITSRTLSVRMDAGRHRDQEIRSIAQALDNLLDRLEHAFTTVSRFTSDASHELLTPLTVIRQDLDVTLRKPRSADDYRATLERLRGDTERLTRIVRSLLALSRIDQGVRQPAEVSDLSLVVREECDAASARARSCGVALVLHHAEVPSPACASDTRLHAIVANLIENALRFTPPGGTVDLTIETSEPGTVQLRVRDSGPGLPSGEEDRIFDRFYRGTNTLENTVGGAGIEGSGLGLAIVRSYVDADHGRITARTHPTGGAEFTLTWATP